MYTRNYSDVMTFLKKNALALGDACAFFDDNDSFTWKEVYLLVVKIHQKLVSCYNLDEKKPFY